MEPDIEKWLDYDKIVKFADFCRKLIADNEESIVIDNKSFKSKRIHKSIIGFKLQKKLFTSLTIVSTIHLKKKVKSFYLYSTYDHLMNK